MTDPNATNRPTQITPRDEKKPSKPLSEAEELELLEMENEELTRRAKIVELRIKNEELRRTLDKKVEPTFLNERTNLRVPERFRGTIKYRVMKQIYRPMHGLLEPGETVELTDERPSKALKPIKEEKNPQPAKPQQASMGRASNQQT